MCGYGFEETDVPDWWIDNVLKDNQAQGILDYFEEHSDDQSYNKLLNLGYCIILVTNPENPVDISYMIQHLRIRLEGERLLKSLAKYNIPAHTEVSFPSDFIKTRYKDQTVIQEKNLLSLDSWTTQIWEDYCSYLVALHGKDMLVSYFNKQ